MKNSLDSFRGQALPAAQIKAIRGGQIMAYCTTGNNATCYRDVNDASKACQLEPTC